jgi:DNA-binding SARP family transcriptional activator
MLSPNAPEAKKTKYFAKFQNAWKSEFKWCQATFDRNKKFSSASKVVRLVFAQWFITIFNCRYLTSNHLSVCHKPTSLSPISCQSVDNCCIIINTLINLHDPIDQSRSKYYLRTKFQDGIDKPQKCQNVCHHTTHQQQSDFLF